MVPILVYFFHIDPVIATTYSLFIVGITSLTGSVGFFKKGLVDMRTLVQFGIPSLISVFLSRKILVPLIPEQLGFGGHFSISKGNFFMVLFAVIMIFSAFSMLRKKESREKQNISRQHRPDIFVLVPAGLILGLITGMLGAGGGFLIIPVLVLWVRLPMKKAIATSLAIIATNSLIGFLFSLGQTPVSWDLFLPITLIAIAGIIIGSRMSAHINGFVLKKSFGVFILFVAAFIFLRAFTGV